MLSIYGMLTVQLYQLVGVVRNAHEAVRLYTIAAKQHFPVAQTLLGEAYPEGRLILADLDGGESLLAFQ
jgi:TPR repeat protein